MKQSSHILTFAVKRARIILAYIRKLAGSKAAKQIGYLVFTITLILILWLVIQNYRQFKLLVTGFDFRWVLLSFVFISFCFVTLATSWHQILQGYGVNCARYRIMRIYFLTGIGRYLPGGVWHFGGRVVWLEQLTVPLKISTEALLTEQISVLWVGLVLGAGFALAKFASTVLLFLAGGILLSLWIAVMRARFQACNARLPARRLVYLAGLYIVFWLAYGSSIYWLVLASGQLFNPANLIQTIGYACLSWVVGYVIIFVPGGVGIREGMLAGLLSGMMPLPVAGTIALLARGVSMSAEALLALIFVKIRQ